MLDHLILVLSLLDGGQFGVGTVFGSSHWDKHNPHSRLACLHREIDDARDFVVAHNTLPCGTAVWVFNPRTGRSVLAHVADRGPRHADVDLSVAVARTIAHNGKENVLLVPLWSPPPRRRPAAGELVSALTFPAPVEETWAVPDRVLARLGSHGGPAVEDAWRVSGRLDSGAWDTGSGPGGGADPSEGGARITCSIRDAAEAEAGDGPAPPDDPGL